MDRARELVNSFKLEPFKPYISANAHVQTILGNAFAGAPDVNYNRVSLRTADGLDVLQIDIAGGTTLAPDIASPAKPVVLLLHGLESSSTGVVSRRFSHAFESSGFKVVALNYRSCQEPMTSPVTLKLYHAGFCEDVITTLLAIRTAAGTSGQAVPRVFLVGFSLGANILCNFLREAGDYARETYGVVGAFGICVPFDPAHCQRTIDYGYRRYLYSRRLTQSMVRRFSDALAAGAPLGNVDSAKVKAAEIIGDIDDALISPVFGFKDKNDYYQHVDARNCLKFVSVPTLLINCRNDPFFNHSPGCGLPTDAHLDKNAPVRLVTEADGGHCGFFDYNAFAGKEPSYIGRVAAQFCSHINENL